MRLLRLEIKHFGKLNHKELEFDDGINIVYGENEAGKSTLLTFIRAMMFGMERKRGKAAATDTYSMYEPWDHPEGYAGKLGFDCDGKEFLLKRNFARYAKTSSLVCLEDGEQLSVEDGDLDMLLDGLTENSYKNTLCIGQLHAATGAELATELKNYAGNYYMTGDSEVNLAGAQERLVKEKKEVDRRGKVYLQEKQLKRMQAEQESSYIWREVHRLEEDIEDTESDLEKRQAEEKEKRESQKNTEIGGNSIIDALRPAKWRIHPLEILFMVATLVLLYWLIPNPVNGPISIIFMILSIIYTWNRMKVGKKKPKSESEQILEEIAQEENASVEKLAWELERLRNEHREKQIEYENIQEQLQEMDEVDDTYMEIDRREKALLLALERLQEVSSDMQSNVAKVLNAKTSEKLEVITGGKYTRFLLDEGLKMFIFHEERRVPIEALSQGTIEQVYLAFRLAAAEVLYQEKYPLILDDTFVYYDDVRLEQTLQMLKRYKGQVILFTCQKREEAVLKQLGIKYSLVTL